VLAEETRSHGLNLRGGTYSTTSPDLTLEVGWQGGQYWRDQTPLAPIFFTQRLVALAAELSADPADIFRTQPMYRSNEAPAREHGLLIRRYPSVVTVSPLGWRVFPGVIPPDGQLDFRHNKKFSYGYLRRNRPVLIDAGLAADLDEVKDAIVDAILSFERSRWGPVPCSIPTLITIVGTAAVTSIIVPFVQAMAGKTADDAYNVLRTRILRRIRQRTADKPGLESPAETEDDQGDLIAILDQETNTELVMPFTLPDAAIMQLVQLNPDHIAGHVLTWDEHAQCWRQARRRKHNT
jgi:hypothetical protein